MSEWISVEDRLPEDGTIVLTYGAQDVAGVDDDEDMCTAYFRYLGGDLTKPVWQEHDLFGDFMDFDPTHWMPLPEPPKA